MQYNVHCCAWYFAGRIIAINGTHWAPVIFRAIYYEWVTQWHLLASDSQTREGTQISKYYIIFAGLNGIFIRQKLHYCFWKVLSNLILSISTVYFNHVYLYRAYFIASSFLLMPIYSYKDILTACTSLTKSYEQFGKSHGSCPSATS